VTGGYIRCTTYCSAAVILMKLVHFAGISEHLSAPAHHVTVCTLNRLFIVRLYLFQSPVRAAINATVRMNSHPVRNLSIPLTANSRVLSAPNLHGHSFASQLIQEEPYRQQPYTEVACLLSQTSPFQRLSRKTFLAIFTWDVSRFNGKIQEHRLYFNTGYSYILSWMN
jgi:hypothetical protein